MEVLESTFWSLIFAGLLLCNNALIVWGMTGTATNIVVILCASAAGFVTEVCLLVSLLALISSKPSQQEQLSLHNLRETLRLTAFKILFVIGEIRAAHHPKEGQTDDLHKIRTNASSTSEKESHNGLWKSQKSTSQIGNKYVHHTSMLASGNTEVHLTSPLSTNCESAKDDSSREQCFSPKETFDPYLVLATL